MAQRPTTDQKRQTEPLSALEADAASAGPDQLKSFSSPAGMLMNILVVVVAASLCCALIYLVFE
jgi:hypothetical protein